MGRPTSLTGDQIKQIRRWRKQGTPYKVIARRIGCTMEKARYWWNVQYGPARNKHPTSVRIITLSSELQAQIAAAQAESGGVLRPYR